MPPRRARRRLCAAVVSCFVSWIVAAADLGVVNVLPDASIAASIAGGDGSPRAAHDRAQTLLREAESLMVRMKAIENELAELSRTHKAEPASAGIQPTGAVATPGEREAHVGAQPAGQAAVRETPMPSAPSAVPMIDPEKVDSPQDMTRFVSVRAALNESAHGHAPTMLAGAFWLLQSTPAGARRAPKSASARAARRWLATQLLLRVSSDGRVHAHAIAPGHTAALPVVLVRNATITRCESVSETSVDACAVSAQHDPWIAVASKRRVAWLDAGYAPPGRGRRHGKVTWPRAAGSRDESAELEEPDEQDDVGMLGLQRRCDVTLAADVMKLVAFSNGAGAVQNWLFAVLKDDTVVHVRSNCSVASTARVPALSPFSAPIMSARRGSTLAVSSGSKAVLSTAYSAEWAQVCTLPQRLGAALEPPRITALAFDRLFHDVLWVGAADGRMAAFSTRSRSGGDAECRLLRVEALVRGSTAPIDAIFALGRYLFVARQGRLSLLNVTRALQGEFELISTSHVSPGAGALQMYATEPTERHATTGMLVLQPTALGGDTILLDMHLPAPPDPDEGFDGVIGWLRVPVIVLGIAIVVIMQQQSSQHGGDTRGFFTRLAATIGSSLAVSARGPVGHAMRTMLGKRVNQAMGLDEEDEAPALHQRAFSRPGRGMRGGSTRPGFSNQEFGRAMSHLQQSGDYEGMLEAVLAQARSRSGGPRSDSSSDDDARGSRFAARDALEPDVDELLREMRARMPPAAAASAARAARLGARGVGEHTPAGTQEWAAMQAAMASLSGDRHTHEHVSQRMRTDASDWEALAGYDDASDLARATAHTHTHTAHRVAAAHRAGRVSPSNLLPREQTDVRDQDDAGQSTIEKELPPARRWAQYARAADSDVLDPSDSD